MNRRFRGKWRPIVLLLLVCIGMLGFTAFAQGGPLRHKLTAVLNNGADWEVHVGKLPVDGGFVTDVGTDWLPYPEALAALSPQAVRDGYWARATLPALLGSMRDPHLLVNGATRFELYVDNRLQFSYGGGRLQRFELPIFAGESIPLSPQAAGQTLLLHIVSEGQTLSLGNPAIVEGREQLLHTFAYDMLRAVFTVCFLFLLFLALTAYLLYVPNPAYLYFALLNGCAAYACIALSAFVSFYIEAPLFHYGFLLCYPAGAWAAVGILERLSKAGHRRQYRRIRHLFLAYLLVCAAGAGINDKLYMTLVFYGFTALILIAIPYLVIPKWRTFRRTRTTDEGWLAAGIGCLAVCIVVDLVVSVVGPLNRLLQHSSYPVLYWVDNLSNLGLFLFVLCLAMIFVSRMHAVHKKVQAYVDKIRNKNRRLRELDRIKDDFLANTSHELRTPLQGIIGLSESMLDGVAGPMSDKAHYNLQLVVASGRRLSGLVDDLLDLAKLEHHDISLELEPIRLKEAASVVLSAFESFAAVKPVRLLNEIDDTAPLVMADKNRLQQILYNLIGNAIKFTDEGEVRVTAEPEPDGSRMRVAVRDTGVGIPEDRLLDVLEPFEQAGGPYRGGTGLGLSITSRLVTLHGGQLELASKPGEGTVCTFTLPTAGEAVSGAGAGAGAGEAARSEIAPPALARQPHRTVPTAPAGLSAPALLPPVDRSGPATAPMDDALSGAVVLVVDDEPVNLEVLDGYLSALPLRVEKAATGADALRSIERIRPDLILLDVMLPDRNGYDLCRSIRERYALGELPVLMLTAKDRLSDMLAGFDAGANDYIAKPVARHELLARVRVHLTLARLTARLEQMVTERTADLEQTTARLKDSVMETAAALAEAAVMSERNRIAQDIHDHVGHTLTTTIVQLEAAIMLLERGDPRGLEKAKLSQTLVRKGLDDIREAVRVMKQHDSEFNLETEIGRLLTQTAETTDCVIDSAIAPLPPLTPMQKNVLFHALKEGITNGIRHGRGERFRFRLEPVGGRLRFELWNDGRTYEATELGFGLQTMNEHVRALGGSLELTAPDGAGCLLTITLPL